METLTGFEIFINIISRFWIVWIGLIIIFTVSIMTKRKSGLYGKLFDSPIGMVGFALILFWVLTALFADIIMTHDPLSQMSGMKNKGPGTPLRTISHGDYPWYLLGGDHLARDVFSRVVAGSRIVLQIAPLATAFAFMVGITLGLPAGYFGKRVDTILSFLANLILAFPVILLFYLLVTPEIIATGLPRYLSGVLFLFPMIFLILLWQSRFHIKPKQRNKYVFWTLFIGGWVYLGAAFNADPIVLVRSLFYDADTVFHWLPKGLVSMQPNILIVFVAVVFVNSPTVFRIVRGLAMDIQTRDYVAAAQTRGETSWYIMLWEILPNARGPLIVDFCLRIGYTIILLGTLGFFGLGLEPESPDWGTTINSGRKLLTIYAHPALPPALSLMSLVLGLNLLADGLREQSLKD